MSKFFAPDSFFSRIFGTAADLIILNFLFILTSLPILTIGASSGMEAGHRYMVVPAGFCCHSDSRDFMGYKLQVHICLCPAPHNPYGTGLPEHICLCFSASVPV